MADAESAMRMYHWFFLTRPQRLPETLIGWAPEASLSTTLESWAGAGFVFYRANIGYAACFWEQATIGAPLAFWSGDKRSNDEPSSSVADKHVNVAA